MCNTKWVQHEKSATQEHDVKKMQHEKSDTSEISKKKSTRIVH